jgi:diguanylate cyclase (GGDEF)-like protein
VTQTPPPTFGIVEDSDEDFAAFARVVEQLAPESRLTRWPRAEATLDALAAQADVDFPRILIVDLSLPGIDGCELVRRLRENAATRKLPAFILSGSSRQYDIDRCYQAGANAYLTKPSSSAELAALVHMLLQSLALFRQPTPLQCGPLEFDTDPQAALTEFGSQYERRLVAERNAERAARRRAEDLQRIASRVSSSVTAHQVHEAVRGELIGSALVQHAEFVQATAATAPPGGATFATDREGGGCGILPVVSPSGVVLAYLRVQAEHEFDEDQRGFLSQAADLTGRGLDRIARAATAARRTTSPSDLPIDRWLREALARELRHAARDHRELTVVVVDIDHFDRLMQHHGAVVADRALLRVCDAWRTAGHDLLSRNGAEAFVALLPGLDLRRAGSLAAEVRRKTPVPVSFGIAEWDGGESASRLLSRADAALAERRRSQADEQLALSGRDRTARSPSPNNHRRRRSRLHTPRRRQYRGKGNVIMSESEPTNQRVQVTRQRGRVSKPSHVRRAIVAVGASAIVLVSAGVAYATTDIFGRNQVGTEYASGIQVSDDQIIKPLGDRLVTQTGKFMGSTVSPNGRYLAATSTDKSVALQVFDLSSYKQIWSVGTAAGVSQKFANTSVGQEGPTYSPDGQYLWVPEKDAVSRFPVTSDGTLGAPATFAIPKVGGHSALVGQIKYSPDGSTVYAAINGQNTVVALDPVSGAVERTWEVGTAPRELAFVGDKLYVTNEGGRRAKPGETTLDSYGTAVPADGYYGTSTTGSVSVINTSNASAPVGSIAVGLHPTALFVQPGVVRGRGRNTKQSASAVFVANTNSDTISVINPAIDKVVQTIATDPWPSSDTGYAPTSIAMGQDDHLLVTLGRANAVAVYRYNGKPQEPVDYVGLLPTDYYPATIASVGRQVVVTNTRGIDARGPALTFNKGQGTTVAVGHGTHSTTASLTRFTLPRDRDIARIYTGTVFAQNGWGKHDVQQSQGRPATPAPVPARVGDPSPIKHVFLLVKENRTYDQVYGDMSEGNGDATLAQFGATVTPNQHALAKQFGLYDNTYDVGTNSAEGHNWLMQGDNPEYTESSAGEYTRSYDTEEDVLGHQRSGFLWTAVQDAGNTARNYGEFEYTEGKPSGSWQQYYCASQSVEAGGDPAQLLTPELKGDYGSVIPSLNAIADHQSPPFDTAIPDIYRYQIWKQDFEQHGPANLNMMWLSSDHTGGTADPRAQVADGDLAVGKIADTISHSKYWKDSVIFVVEDDSQDGADHVDGHRAPIQIISPYAQHGVVDSTYYSQINMVRTIEQILGAQPLNQRVAAATPLYGAFTSKPDLTPFAAVPNQVPLTEGVATPPACGLDTPDQGSTGTTPPATTTPATTTPATTTPATTTPATTTPATTTTATTPQQTAVPADAGAIATAWTRWLRGQHTTGNGAVPDYANPEQMNRYTWYAAHDWKVPYPGDRTIYLPSKVPGASIPSPDTN